MYVVDVLCTNQNNISVYECLSHIMLWDFLVSRFSIYIYNLSKARKTQTFKIYIAKLFKIKLKKPSF